MTQQEIESRLSAKTAEILKDKNAQISALQAEDKNVDEFDAKIGVLNLKEELIALEFRKAELGNWLSQEWYRFHNGELQGEELERYTQKQKELNNIRFEIQAKSLGIQKAELAIRAEKLAKKKREREINTINDKYCLLLKEERIKAQEELLNLKRQQQDEVTAETNVG